MNGSRSAEGSVLLQLFGVGAFFSMVLGTIELRTSVVQGVYFTDEGCNWMTISAVGSFLVGAILLLLARGRRLHWVVGCFGLICGATLASIGHVAAAYSYRPGLRSTELGFTMSAEGGGILLEVAVALATAGCLWATRGAREA